MPMFLVQSAILLAIAFITGCSLGCLLLRWLGAEGVVPPATVSTASIAAPSSIKPAPEHLPETETNQLLPVAAPDLADVSPALDPVSQPKIVSKPKTRSKPKAAAKVKTVSAQKVAGPVVAVKAAIPNRSKSEKKQIAARLSTPIGGKPDNLTLVNGIGNVIEKRLHDIGVFHFAQIAVWTKDQAQEFSVAVGFPGRAAREGWMKEAALFAKGGTTDHARKVEAGTVPSSRKSSNTEKATANRSKLKK